MCVHRFLQDYDNTSTSVDWSTNPLGLLGFYQATASVPDVTSSTAWYQRHVSTLTPLTSYVDYRALFGTAVAVAVVGRARLEHVYQNNSVENPSLFYDPPFQAHFHGLVSVGLAVRNVTAAAANLKAQQLLMPFTYARADGTASVWIRDSVNILLEFTGPV
jgi:hypothetical protein